MKYCIIISEIILTTVVIYAIWYADFDDNNNDNDE
jgi:hypothetical protein